MSASNNPTAYPSKARFTAIPDATVDFPTPPFPEATMIIFLVLSILIWKIPHNYASKSNEFVFDIANKE
jgi:hypothetical protein